MPQQDQSSLIPYSDFVEGVREQARSQGYDLSSMSDEEVYSKMAKKDPSIVKGVVEPRRAMKQPESSGFDRFAQGMAAVPTASITGLPGALKGAAENMGQGQKSVYERYKKQGPASPGELLDIPNIKKDWQSDNKAGAAGRTTTQALMLGLMSKGMMPEAKAESSMGEMEAIGKPQAKDYAMNIAKTVAKPHAEMLDSMIADVEKGMDNQFIDAQKLGADSAYAAKVLKGMKNVPEAQLAKFNAAKDAVAQLTAKIKANPRLMPWKDARGILKQVSQAEKSMPAGTAQDAMREIRKGLEDRLQTTADAAGQGEAYSKWVKGYRRQQNLERAGARIFKQQTASQKTTKMTAKAGPNLGIRGVARIQFGESVADKVAKTNKEMLGKWHKALDEHMNDLKQPLKKSGKPMAGGSVESATEEARRRGMPQQNPAGQMPNMAKPPQEPF